MKAEHETEYLPDLNKREDAYEKARSRRVKCEKLSNKAFGCIMQRNFGRDYDNCFEMGDSDRVIDNLIVCASQNTALLVRILQHPESMPPRLYKAAKGIRCLNRGI